MLSLFCYFSPSQVIPHKSIKESYRTFPCAEILFEHDNGRNRDFRCNIELTADDTTIQICAVASIKEVNITEKWICATGQLFKNTSQQDVDLGLLFLIQQCILIQYSCIIYVICTATTRYHVPSPLKSL